MAFRVVLDACSLYPWSLRDTLLRCAAAELYDAYWSERILEEMRGNLVKRGVVTEEKSAILVETMKHFFPEAMIPGTQIVALEPAMTNDEKDRHVLAAGVAVGAGAIVTFNLPDFPDAACAPHCIEALHPDEFLMVMRGISEETIRSVIKEQAGDLTRPPFTFEELVRSIGQAAPRFAAAMLDENTP